jgi:hypothetical protein
MHKMEDQMNNNDDITTKIAENSHVKIGEPVKFDDLEANATKIVRIILQEWIESSEEILAKPETRCRECGNFANYISKRIGFIQSQFGTLRYKRAYYVCPHCHQSTCPLDERLDPIGSLARLRAKLAAGKQLPVAEIARDWGLGSLLSTSLTSSSDFPKEAADRGGLGLNLRYEQFGSISSDYFPRGISI